MDLRAPEASTRQRIGVDDSLPEVRLDAELLHELCRHAVEAEPEECCGLLVSRGPRRYGSAVRCRNEMTRLHREDPERYPRDGRSAYHMNERDILAVCAEAERQGETVTAIYHSHVGAGAYLSPTDLRYAEDPLFPFPGADQIVISVFETAVGERGLFRRREGEGEGEWVGQRIAADPA